MEEYMPFVWIGIAVVMAVGEAVTNQLVSIWFVVGALCAAVSSLITSSVLVQVIVFIVIAFGTLIATKPIVDKYKKKAGKALKLSPLLYFVPRPAFEIYKLGTILLNRKSKKNKALHTNIQRITNTHLVNSI